MTIVYAVRPYHPPAKSFVIGLDMGQLSERTAASIIEEDGDACVCRHLHVWMPGTPHTKILADTVELVRRVREEESKARVRMAFGVSTVGPAIRDEFVAALRPQRVDVTSITVTGGTAEPVLDDGKVSVPKRDLVSVIRTLLEGRRFRVAVTVPHADILEKELRGFKIEGITNDDTVDWRKKDTDDLVLATAMACWLCVKPNRPSVMLIQAIVRGRGGGPNMRRSTRRVSDNDWP